MTVRVYYSTDSGAPTLTNAFGDLINVLDACLVNGYGTKDPAGWSKPFSGTNKAVYRQGGDATSHHHYLRVDQSTFGGTGAHVRGYIEMTDIDTGTGMFPSSVQVIPTSNYYWYTSSISTPRPWMIVATEKTFYLKVNAASAAINGTTISVGVPAISTYLPHTYMFGDINSYDTGDFYRCLLIGCGGAISTTYCPFLAADYRHGLFSSPYHYMSIASPAARTLQTNARSVAVSKAYTVHAGYTDDNTTSGQYYGLGPHALNGKFPLSRCYIIERSTPGGYSTGTVDIVRGELPGIYFLPAKIPGFEDGDTLPPISGLEGKTLMYMASMNNGSYGYAAIETSDTW